VLQGAKGGRAGGTLLRHSNVSRSDAKPVCKEKHCCIYRLPREMMESPSLEVFKKHVDWGMV